MRAGYPDTEGFADRDGTKLWYEVYGEGDPTVLLMPTWAIFHSRHWKMQIPFLSRHFRVVTFDGRGNGRSDRPTGEGAYGDMEIVADAIAVLDATGTDRAIVAGLSAGGHWVTLLASEHPDRIDGVVAIAPSVPFGPPHPDRAEVIRWDDHIEDPQGWEKYNRHYWLEDYPDFVRFFVGEIFSEPHSTKQLEDGVGWGLETDGPTLVATDLGPFVESEEALRRVQALDTPVLVIHGTDDHLVPADRGLLVAAETGGETLILEGSGHAPLARDPVQVNLAMKAFIDKVSGTTPPNTTWRRGKGRAKRALYISSPIGLGHARRDVAIADELRKLHPDLQIDWLAQDPVTRVLEANGEHIHPASRWAASEVAHIDSESAEHSLHCFQAWRRMDEILLANFMIYNEVVASEQYDLVIGDEAWEVDYYLHENPGLKNAAYVWMTDFVGWLPMPSGGDHEAYLTADYNAEMISHIARYPRTRDRAIFVGHPEDIVDERFGPDLPHIRQWTEDHYDFSGYVTGFDPQALGDRDELRDELGYGSEEKLCIVTVGGTAVGAHLLRRVIDAYPQAKAQVPELRMIVVAGPRIDPNSLPGHDGLTVLHYVDRLYRHLAVADLAVVQGGLTTTMELTTAKTPFLYVPLADHFEQNFHVTARLDRYRAGRRLLYQDIDPDGLAEAISEEIGRNVNFADVETDGAVRAASLIAELI